MSRGRRRRIVRSLIRRVAIGYVSPIDGRGLSGEDLSLWAVRRLQLHRDGDVASKRAARAAGASKRESAKAHLAAAVASDAAARAHRRAAASDLDSADAIEASLTEVAAAHRGISQILEVFVASDR